jgi:hypothetical protein
VVKRRPYFANLGHPGENTSTFKRYCGNRLAGKTSVAKGIFVAVKQVPSPIDSQEE